MEKASDGNAVPFSSRKTTWESNGVCLHNWWWSFAFHLQHSESELRNRSHRELHNCPQTFGFPGHKPLRRILDSYLFAWIFFIKLFIPTDSPVSAFPRLSSGLDRQPWWGSPSMEGNLPPCNADKASNNSDVIWWQCIDSRQSSAPVQRSRGVQTQVPGGFLDKNGNQWTGLMSRRENLILIC